MSHSFMRVVINRDVTWLICLWHHRLHLLTHFTREWLMSHNEWVMAHSFMRDVIDRNVTWITCLWHHHLHLLTHCTFEWLMSHNESVMSHSSAHGGDQTLNIWISRSHSFLYNQLSDGDSRLLPCTLIRNFEESCDFFWKVTGTPVKVCSTLWQLWLF